MKKELTQAEKEEISRKAIQRIHNRKKYPKLKIFKWMKQFVEFMRTIKN